MRWMTSGGSLPAVADAAGALDAMGEAEPTGAPKPPLTVAPPHATRTPPKPNHLNEGRCAAAWRVTTMAR